MAITTLDGVIAGMQAPRYVAKGVSGTLVAGRPQSFWGVAGSPGAGSWANTLNGVVLSSSSAMVAGQVPFTNPVSGNTYLARMTGAAAQAGTLVLADRIWHNQLTVNSTSAQSPTTPTWPSRDVGGSTNGDGILVGIETSSAASATATTITMTYTNQAGTGSRTASFLDATAATATIAGAFFRIGLQAGDTGVRSIQTFQFGTAWSSGTINAVAYRPLASIACLAAQVTDAIDALTGGMPRLFDGSVPYFFFVPSTTTTTGIHASVVLTQG